ncbi:TRAP transporter large permease subunit [Rhodoferax sp. BAB1]|uniref:TRAP transporter large permease n=1 Tax=Rhodoferax sp. BAB1 TaxID=2741720 RepID=UPI001574FACF|nr:TRAP transporter large permease subunit [Rhodoferax sp. BAB1]QKO23035.1 TRAP transporter large permease subunit [Rhodoferax sp. BAB1]
MKIRKELWFGFSLMGLIILAAIGMLLGAEKITNGHIGLLMLSLVVVAIMLGFPTAFTLMGMGMIFTWIAYEENTTKTLDLMVSAAFKVMSNDVLISIPLFVFMGYLVERANLIEKLFRSLHLALARLPGALAVATLVTCAVFATATGIVGAVVTLMGLLALPQMLRAGYDVKLSAGAITAGGCLGILIPPSVMLIVYGATAGVSVVQLYAGAFFPGLMLAGLYILYVIIVAKLKPHMAPPLSEKERYIPLPPLMEKIAPAHSARALPALLKALKGRNNADVPTSYILKQLAVVLAPLVLFLFVALWSYAGVTSVPPLEETSTLQSMGEGNAEEAADDEEGGLAVPPGTEEEDSASAAPAAAEAVAAPAAEPVAAASAEPAATSKPAPAGFWIGLGVGALAMAIYYGLLSFTRLEVFKMLLTSFFPLLVLILAVLGSIVMGLATPTEAAAVGALGGFLLAAAYRQLTLEVVKESVFLTAKTSAMVCWLFVGSAIFSAAFALLGGQELVENWVMSMNLTKTQFLVLSQVIIFILGWPLEWTEIIVIFMPIFIPLLDNFGVDPLFFGLLVALNLQTAFLSPPVAMAAFYLKGVSPPHVTLNQIFAGMLPFMGIQVIAIIILYNFPGIGMWLPQVLYK